MSVVSVRIASKEASDSVESAVSGLDSCNKARDSTNQLESWCLKRMARDQGCS